MEVHPLQSLCNNSPYICRSYSGRSMYGKYCLGIDLDGVSLGEFISYVICEIDDDEDRQMISEAFQDMREDNMGRNSIIVYFPTVSFVGDEEDGNGLEED